MLVSIYRLKHRLHDVDVFLRVVQM